MTCAVRLILPSGEDMQSYGIYPSLRDGDTVRLEFEDHSAVYVVDRIVHEFRAGAPVRYTLFVYLGEVPSG